jgi:dolichol-phosphate mannosyltransferase
MLCEIPPSWRAVPLTIVVPTYNEAENLPGVVDLLSGLPLDNLSILVVDDNSPDGTGQVADKLAAERPDRMHVVHRKGKSGLGSAYIAGMSRAVELGAQYVVQMDADGSHPADAIPGMLATALATNAGLVVGSRYVPGGSVDETWSRRRKLLSAWANFYVNAILRVRVRDVTAGFNLWRADVLSDIDLSTIRSGAYGFQVEMKYRAAQAGNIMVEVPIHFTERAAGESKMSLSVQLESAIRPWQIRFSGKRSHTERA